MSKRSKQITELDQLDSSDSSNHSNEPSFGSLEIPESVFSSPKTSKSSNKSISPTKISPTQPMPTVESRFMKIEESLSALAPYIQKNKARIPYFKTSDDAENELRTLKAQLKKQNQRRSLKSRKNEFDSQLSEIKRQHDAIHQEQDAIAELKASIREQSKNDDNEYKEFLENLDNLKIQLEDERSKKQKHENKYRNAQETVEMLKEEHQNSAKEIEKLLKVEEKLKQQKAQLLNEIKQVEAKNEQIAAEERNLELVEGDTDNKMNEIKRLEKEVGKKKKIIAKMSKEVSEMFSQAFHCETDLDQIVSQLPQKMISQLGSLSPRNSILSNKSNSPKSYASVPQKSRQTVSFAGESLDSDDDYSSDETEKQLSQIKSQMEQLTKSAMRTSQSPRSYNNQLNDYDSDVLDSDDRALIEEVISLSSTYN